MHFEHGFWLHSDHVIGHYDINVFLRNTMGNAQEFLHNKCYFRGYFQFNSCENVNIMIKHTYFNALMFVESPEDTLNSQPGGCEIEQSPQALAYVNA